MKKTKKFSWVLSILVVALFVTACGGNTGSNSNNQSSEGSSNSAEKVTLKFYHWIGQEAGPVVKEINDKFTEKYPHITIEFESAPTDQFETVIKTRLASGDAPDLFGVFPGTKKDPFVEANYLMDLSDQEWVSRLYDSSQSVASYDGKVYALPIDSNVLGVVYNKQIFAELGLEVPTNWDEFLAVSEKIKAANITPIAIGNKDLWITQLIPYAMAPTAIYQENISFDEQMSKGQATFTGSPWKQMMTDYLALDQKGYFNKGVLGTTYDQTVQLIASEKAAMTLNGNWVLSLIKQANPDMDLGMFPLPYNMEGQDAWVASSVGAMTAISATTSHPEEAKLYLDFWASPEILGLYAQERKVFSPLDGVDVDLDPSAKEMEPYIAKGSYNFLDQKWPIGVQDVMMSEIQQVFATGTEESIDNMLAKMDAAYTEANK